MLEKNVENYKLLVEEEERLGCEYGCYSDGDDRVFSPEPGTGITKTKLRELIDDVPDVEDPSEINYWVKINGFFVYLEGWSDICLTGTGFPPIEEGMWDEKVEYIRDLTPGILGRKAKEYGMRLIKGGFKEKTEDDFPEHLYGVTYGVYEKEKDGVAALC